MCEFKHGTNFKQGKYCVIEPNVVVGDNVTLGHFCLLKNGTRFLDNINFADYCKTTGVCIVGNDVNMRTASTISKAVIVEDKAFIGAGVMTSHTKNIHHHRPEMPKRQLITRIGYGAVIGSRSNLSAGVTIGDNVVVGYGSIVTKSVFQPAIYYGNPFPRSIIKLPKEMVVDKPADYVRHNFTEEMLRKYLPYYKKVKK